MEESFDPAHALDIIEEAKERISTRNRDRDEDEGGGNNVIGKDDEEVV